MILRYLQKEFLLTPLREGRRNKKIRHIKSRLISTHAPAGGATLKHFLPVKKVLYFYSRPCGRGDQAAASRHAHLCDFYSRPCGRGDSIASWSFTDARNFYSRPCGRGDKEVEAYINQFAKFLLTPLREGRRSPTYTRFGNSSHFYSRPCGRGDPAGKAEYVGQVFLLTPLRESRRSCSRCCSSTDSHFYSRPCGRGDASRCIVIESIDKISTHAPAGGATRHEHKKRINIADFYSRPCGRGDVFLPVAGSL